MLKLMYITNNVDIALAAQDAGVDRIFIDMEYIGKDVRQAGLDRVKSHHTLEDVRSLRQVIRDSELLVRCNPIHPKTTCDLGSEFEIDELCKIGPDIIMLPYFKTPDEVRRFVSLVDGRVRTMLLFETRQAVENIDEILAIEGIDEVYIGFNDLSISYGYDFMFEPLANGMADAIVEKFKAAGLPYGFGGIGRIGAGMLPAKLILDEHYRLGSSCVILSRSFCNIAKEHDLAIIKKLFDAGVRGMREAETSIIVDGRDFEESHRALGEKVAEITAEIHRRGDASK